MSSRVDSIRYIAPIYRPSLWAGRAITPACHTPAAFGCHGHRFDCPRFAAAHPNRSAHVHGSLLPPRFPQPGFRHPPPAVYHLHHGHFLGEIVRPAPASGHGRAGGGLHAGSALGDFVSAQRAARHLGCLRCPSRAVAGSQEHRRCSSGTVPDLLPRVFALGAVRLRRRAQARQWPGRLPRGVAVRARLRPRQLHVLPRRGVRRLRLEPSGAVLYGRAPISGARLSSQQPGAALKGVPLPALCR